jgi:hypothetical protein
MVTGRVKWYPQVAWAQGWSRWAAVPGLSPAHSPAGGEHHLCPVLCTSFVPVSWLGCYMGLKSRGVGMNLGKWREVPATFSAHGWSAHEQLSNPTPYRPNTFWVMSSQPGFAICSLHLSWVVTLSDVLIPPHCTPLLEAFVLISSGSGHF